MFKIESYVTPILLSYVDKYVKDFKPADAQVSLWGGGVLLQNLVLKTDVLQQEVALPFTLVSGRIHELLIQVPWTKIMSEPIIVTIDTIECILNLRPSTDDDTKTESSSELRSPVVEAPPGYMQALVRRIVSNIAIKVHHLIVKYVQDDIVLSLNVKELSVNSAGPDWKPTFADIEAVNPVIRRLIVLDDLTLCLDRTDSDGKIRFYQDPLLYRCGLEFRVLAKLASANTRRANSFEVEMITKKLAWGITTAQLLLLLRLVKEPIPADNDTPSPTTAANNLTPDSPGLTRSDEPSRHESWSDWAWSWMPTTDRIHGRPETPMASCPVPVSFSAYLDHMSLALKTLETEANNKKRPRSILELTASHIAVKTSLCVPTFLRIKVGIRYLDFHSVGKCPCGHSNSNTIAGAPTIFLSCRNGTNKEWKWPDRKSEIEVAQIAEEKKKADLPKKTDEKPYDKLTSESETRSANKSATEPGTSNAEKSAIQLETDFVDKSDTKSEMITAEKSAEESEMLTADKSAEKSKTDAAEKPAKNDDIVELKPDEKSSYNSADKSDKEGGKQLEFKEAENQTSKETESEKESGPNTTDPISEPNVDEIDDNIPRSRLTLQPLPGLEFHVADMDQRRKISMDALEETFWDEFSPVFSMELVHERSPPNPYINPYDKPPKNFEYSDWEEQSDVYMQLKPMDLRVCMGLIHRLLLIKSVFEELPPVPLEPMRTLTVEECEALNSNIPQRRTNIEIIDFRVNLHPWDHSLVEKPLPPPLLLRVELPKAVFVIATPLYAQRVCSAAGQMPEDKGLLWQACRVHTTAALNDIKISICSPRGDQSKPCGRIDVRFVTHLLLYPEYFEKKHSIKMSYALKMCEANISGSSARLHAAAEVIKSIIIQTPSTPLRQTTLANDALNDEDLVALDITAEDLSTRGFVTHKVTTTISTLQSLRATVFQPSPDKKLQQAWLFSGPDIPTNSPYMRLATQWCVEPFPGSAEFFGLWTEPTAIAIDPLLACWLSYKPSPKLASDSLQYQRHSTSSHSLGQRRSRTTIASSSGRGQSRTSTAEAEQVHKVHSVDSSSEQSEKKDSVVAPPPQAKPAESSTSSWLGDNLLQIHKRLKHVMMAVDLGLFLMYVTTTTATAVGCDTVRGAMDNHAASKHTVMVLSVGHWSLFTNSIIRHLWNIIDQNGPTYMQEQPGGVKESFPWKMLLGDMSCYALEVVKTVPSEPVTGKRSQLKHTNKCSPRTIVDLFSTNVVLSVVTKNLQHKVIVKKADNEKKDDKIRSKEESKIRYFTSGSDFKPSTFLEFLRGPQNRKREVSTQSEVTEASSHDKYKGPVQAIVAGPIISLGFNLHADTPPILCKLEPDQVQLVVTTLHCLKHVLQMMSRNITQVYRNRPESNTASNICRSDMDEEETRSTESVTELITILPTPRDERPQGIKTFFWFQWVISRVTAVVTSNDTKLVMEIEDMSMSLDIQENYDQFKIKIATGSVKHFELSEEQTWSQNPFSGRVLDVVEGIAMEDSHFLSVTITRARISKLPKSWKEELHPKLLHQKQGSDTMWEIYAVLASLDVVVVPSSLKSISELLNTVNAKVSCPPPPQEEVAKYSSTFDLPYCYLNAGGLKITFTCDVGNRKIDDTLILTILKTTINPHPDNPICRQPVTSKDTTWNIPGNLEGRQYELCVKGITLETTLFNQLATKQESLAEAKRSNDNPAVKWSSRTIAEPTFSSILLPLDIDLLLAPALIVGKTFVCGAALEVNLTSDCNIEVNVDQLVFLQAALKELRFAASQKWSVHPDLLKGVCPYVECLQKSNEATDLSIDNTFISMHASQEDDSKKSDMVTGARTVDSGTGTVNSQSKSSQLPDSPVKKKSSVGFIDHRVRDAWDYVEIFFTTGAFDISLYTVDDGSDEIEELKPRKKQKNQGGELTKSSEKDGHDEDKKNGFKLKEKEVTEFGLLDLKKHLTKNAVNVVPLLHLTLHQPNLYYWKKRSQINVQISLFNMWFGLGTVLMDGYWHSPILSTARGIPDPDTEIPPALATLKYTSGAGSSASLHQRGTLNLDIERPVYIQASEENVCRLIGIKKTINSKLMEEIVVVNDSPQDPAPYKLRQLFIDYVVEMATIRTSQIGLEAAGATVAVDSSSLQVTLSPRRDQLDARGLISALFLTTTLHHYEYPHPILHPVHIGLLMNASWEAWRRAEGGTAAKQPSVRLLVEVDSVTVDLSPDNLIIVQKFLDLLLQLKKSTQNLIIKTPESKKVIPDHNDISSQILLQDKSSMIKLPGPKEDSPEIRRSSVTKPRLEKKSSLNANISGMSSLDSSELGTQHYRDDLRSGAFKIVTGVQLPMAYQVTLYKNVISWRYPHPRAISRIVAFPLPNLHKEVDCVLEFYCMLLDQWEPYIDIKVPASEPKEFILHSMPPEMIFSAIWRIRVVAEDAEKATHKFDLNRFLPVSDPTGLEYMGLNRNCGTSQITAEQLSGIINVDSYFNPSQTPQACLTLRLGKLDLYVHNAIRKVDKPDTYLEGYYVSKPLNRWHRTVLLSAEDAMMNVGCDSPAGAMLLFQTHLLTEIVECSTGTMEPLTDRFKLQAGLSIPDNLLDKSRVRLFTTRIRTALHLSRLRTVQALADDWKNAFKQHMTSPSTNKEELKEEKVTTEEVDVATALEGRVSLWIHNTCCVALRLGQESTDEMFPVGPGVKLAYRWRDPDGKKRLRFAVADQNNDWQWSPCVTFAVGDSRVRLPDGMDSRAPGAGVFLHVTVKQVGVHRLMRLSGRLFIANMLKWGLLYKVRAEHVKDKSWSTVSSGELNGESVGPSIICTTYEQMVLKLKFVKQDCGWSGDIPLKECPKENVPWLVKVPSEGDVPYISVWCRVVRARTDGRVLALIWPLYVLRSHLTLATDVLLETDLKGSRQSSPEAALITPAPLIQTAPGRGVRSHLLCPGTTSAKHSLSFQYRNVECPVTREAVPLHYGVTDTSVFDKRTPVNTIEEVLKDVLEWIKGGDQQPDPYWPHSIVSRHWNGQWKSTLMQPRCDVVVRYQAVRVGGGGCCLEMRLSPVLLLCNASPVLVTLRGHDAAPICKLEPGSVVSPPSIVLEKPFFISMEIGRETFVSRQLEVCSTAPGRYTAPPPGQLAVDHPTTFAIPCNHKVTILNAHYEIKDDYSVIGLSPTYVFINQLEMGVLVSTTTLPNEEREGKPCHLYSFVTITVQPCQPNSGTVEYVPLCQFAQKDRWRGGDVSELAMYLTVALDNKHSACPVRLGAPPYRKPLALLDKDDQSIAVVVTQQKHEGRWVVTLSRDPCPQFLVVNHTSVPVYLAQPYPTSDSTPGAHLKLMPECEGVYWHFSLLPGQSRHYSGPAHQLSQPLPSHQPRALPLLALAHQQAVAPLLGPRAPAEPAAAVAPAARAAAARARASAGGLLPGQSRHYSGPAHQLSQPLPSHQPRALPLLALAHQQAGLDPVWHGPVEMCGGEQLVQLVGGATLKLRAHPYPHSTLLELHDVQYTDLSASDIRNRLAAPTNSREDLLGTSEGASTIGNKRGCNFEENKFSTLKLDMEQLEEDLYKFIAEQKKDSMIKTKSEHSISQTSVAVIVKNELAEENEPRRRSMTEALMLPENQNQDATSNDAYTSPIKKEKGSSITEQDTLLANQEKDIFDKDESTLYENIKLQLTVSQDIKTSRKSVHIENPLGKSDNISPEEQKHLTKRVTITLDNSTEGSETINQTGMISELFTIPGEKLLGLKNSEISSLIFKEDDITPGPENSYVLLHEKNHKWDDSMPLEQDRVRCMISSVVVEMAAAEDLSPLLAVHVDQTHVVVSLLNKKIKTRVSIMDVQVDNLQYESGQFDFPVIAATRPCLGELERLPTVWNLFADQRASSERRHDSRLTLQTCHDTWAVMSHQFCQLTEIDFRAGPIALYVEDAYVKALAHLVKIAFPPTAEDYDSILRAEATALQKPLQLRLLQIHPIDLTLTLHTAVRMYIALDQSPLHLNAFTLHHMFTSPECLAHALTVHYLSAAILSAGWVVGGLELLGAPGALAARVGGASGGVRGVASTTAAALLRSLSACAGSLARNLDLLAGDEEHARRAAAARRRPPQTFVEGLIAGITNFAINILGAVGGLAHHPLVGVAVGEGSSAAALRRSLVGAVAKPLSATADLVAYAGHGLLRQTGWDPVPQPLSATADLVAYAGHGLLRQTGWDPVPQVTHAHTCNTHTHSLVGAVAKPLSATADLVAYAGHGLLRQTGWDPVPQPRGRRGQAAERHRRPGRVRRPRPAATDRLGPRAAGNARTHMQHTHTHSLVGAVAKPLSATADLVAYAGHGLLRQTGWDPVPQVTHAHTCNTHTHTHSLVGAVAKPLSATADLVAYAGHGLLRQTGWDPVPQVTHAHTCNTHTHSLVGAVAKPLSATADLVAYAGHGLLRQTGWDPVPQPRTERALRETAAAAVGWRRDCVRWAFRLAELGPVAGYNVLLDDAPAMLLLCSKLFVIVETECERVIEMIEVRHCSVLPYFGGPIELMVMKNKLAKNAESRVINEDDEFHISEAAMARVARYTGAGGLGRASATGAASSAALGSEARLLVVHAAPGQEHALHAALLALVHANADSHFSLF
ncbi:hypothetical protein O0L34_g2954 [Tuta absoluta]|nr:hypothetical protein O0L34_g2954 [Tuta absoluta]